MISLSIVTSKMMKPCGLCGRKFEMMSEPVIRFDSGGPAGRTTRENLCLTCIEGIVKEANQYVEWKKGKEER